MRVGALRALQVAGARAAQGPLSRSLREIHHCLREGAVPEALRLIDRTWRCMPDAGGMLAPIYGRLLLLEGGDPDAALRVLSRVRAPDADVAALTARAYLLLRRSDDARRCLDAALKTYSVEPQGLLSHVASEAVQGFGRSAPGWIGRSSGLEWVGELADETCADSLRISVGETEIQRAVHITASGTGIAFRLPAPAAVAGESLSVSSQGAQLLGSGQRVVPDFALDGRLHGNGRTLLGWARLGWLPTEPLQLRVEDEQGGVILLSTRSVPLPENRWPFRVHPRGRGLHGNRLNVLVRLPDKRWEPLPDAPFLLSNAIRRRTRICAQPPRQLAAEQHLQSSCPFPVPSRPRIDVVIPVYRGLRESLACIQSVSATIGGCARVVVIDDATPEPKLAAALDELASSGRITLVRNDRNLGFVRSVNRMLTTNSGQDVVLLNSDTLVFDGWLRRLSAAAYSAPRVGTVTPFSNDGSIASYPRRFGGAIHSDEAAALAQMAADTHRGISVEIPVGVGFCLYIRHECLKMVGELDAATFGFGYGEESDFCLRARARGWSHRIAADVFVYHAGGGSFGSRRAALLERSQRLLNIRHPGYDRYIAEFLSRDSLLSLRRKLDERRLAAFEGRFTILVTLALEGGVERFVTGRKQKIRAEGTFPLVLKPFRPGKGRRGGCELSTDAIDVPNLRYVIPAELTDLTGILKQLRLERIEIQHFLDHDPAVIDAVRALGVPYDIMIHDYAWICPRVTLIDGSGWYCGEPEVSVCQRCVREHGSRMPKALSVAALRARSEIWLSQARVVLAPSSDTAGRLRRYFPQVNIIVSPHTPLAGLQGQWSTESRNTRVTTRFPGRLRVGLIGAIGSHKGYRVLLGCARDAAARRLPLDFVVIGYTENDRPLLRTGKVDVTGRYVDVEVPHLLQRERPDLMFFPSVWPETWCYALDPILAAGIPAVAFDVGAIAERLSAVGGQTLLPLGLDPAQINDRLLEVGALRKLKEGKTSMQASAHDLQQEEGLRASLQVLPLLPGLYLFSVKSATPSADRGRGSLRLPAMHVGLGPGVRSEHVEFVSGPGIEGAWLFARGDVLVVKINGHGATLILTSVRAPNGEVLSIEVERLESRSEASPTPIVAEKHVELPPAASESKAQLPNPTSSVVSDDVIPLQIKTHVRSRGDMNFADAAWAGRVAPGLWLESFSVQPLRNLSPGDVEYKGLTGTGFETPWLSDDQNCGTKGMSVPLVGFAVRLKPSPETAQYDCEYSGYFQSGTIIGPMRNGAPCRSTVANDPLEGLQLRFVKRAKPTSTTREGTKPLKRAKPEGSPAKPAAGMRSASRP